jgi:hypothetical protein
MMKQKQIIIILTPTFSIIKNISAMLFVFAIKFLIKINFIQNEMKSSMLRDIANYRARIFVVLYIAATYICTYFRSDQQEEFKSFGIGVTRDVGWVNFRRLADC